MFAAVAPGTLLSEDGTVFQRGTMPRSRSLDDLDVMVGSFAVPHVAAASRLALPAQGTLM